MEAATLRADPRHGVIGERGRLAVRAEVPDSPMSLSIRLLGRPSIPAAEDPLAAACRAILRLRGTRESEVTLAEADGRLVVRVAPGALETEDEAPASSATVFRMCHRVVAVEVVKAVVRANPGADPSRVFAMPAVVELDAELATLAGATGEPGLRALDAIHVASALRLGRSSGREPLPAWAAAAGSVLAPAALSYTRRHRVRARFHVTPLAARYCSSRDRGCGAGDGVRTRDLLLGKQTLCQLSYSRSGGRGVHPVRRGMYHPADDTAARSYEMHNPDATAIAILSNDGLDINREYIDKSSRIRARSSRRSIGQVIVSCPASDPGPYPPT